MICGCRHGSKNPIIYSSSPSPPVPLPLSPKWAEKEMTHEISIHHRRVHSSEATDLLILPGPRTYILSSSTSRPIGSLPCLLTYMPATVVTHCHCPNTASPLLAFFFRSMQTLSALVPGPNIHPRHVFGGLVCPGSGSIAQNFYMSSGNAF